MARQTRIEGAKPLKPSLEDQECEWCDDPATGAYEVQKKLGKGVVGTGTFVFACPAHSETAERFRNSKLPKPKTTS